MDHPAAHAQALAPLLKKLRCVQAVATAGHTVGAAALLHIAQSAVVRGVQDVEAALGLRIFERSARGMRPTAPGALIVQRVGRALDLLAGLERPGERAEAAGVPPWLLSRLALSLNARHLQVFLQLAQSGQVQRAAVALGVSASAVHQTLAELEHLSGEALFYRSRGGLRLTDPGETALRLFRLALAELAQAADDLSALRGDVQGHIVIGTLPFSTALFLPQAVEGVLARHPGLTITVVDGTYESLLRQLRFAEIDLIVGALRQPAPPADVTQEVLFEDPLAVVVRRGHPLVRQGLKTLAGLHGAQWVMPMPHTPAQAAFDQAFQAEGLAPPPASLRVNSPLMMMKLLAQSDRVAMMSPRQVDAEVRAGLLCVLPVPVRHAPRHIGLTRRSGQRPTPGVSHLVEAVRDIAAGIARGVG